MASYSTRKDKDGSTVYILRYSRGRGQSQLTERWRPDPTWSPSTVERRLQGALAAFTARCERGEKLSREEMRAAEAEAKAEAARRAAEEAKKPTLSQYVENVWLPSKRITCTESSVREYRKTLDKHVFSVFGEMKLHEITPLQINQFLIDYASTHTSAKPVYQLLSNIFDSAEKNDAVTISPMHKATCPKPNKDTAKTDECKTLDAEELAALLDAAETRPAIQRALVNLLADSGCRIGEALALKWNNIDWKNSTVNITGTRDTVSKEVHNPKTASSKRRITIGPDTVKALQTWREEQSKGGQLLQDVFTGRGGEPLAHTTAYRWLQSLGKEIGVEGLHPHLLRHASATIAIESGADVAGVSKRLGHSKVSTTLSIYTHPSDAASDAAGSAIRNAVKAARAQRSNRAEDTEAQ